jgi:hypothetical protein
MAGWLRAIMVVCPTCGARGGKACVNGRNQPYSIDSPHQSRMEAGNRFPVSKYQPPQRLDSELSRKAQ